MEPGAPSHKSDLFVFALLRLAVGVKGTNPALRLAFVFPDGFIAQNGETVKRLATYADLLGTTASVLAHRCGLAGQRGAEQAAGSQAER